MKALINISQVSALRAGSDIFGNQIIEFDPVDLTQEQRDYLAGCSIDYRSKEIKIAGTLETATGLNVEALASIIDQKIQEQKVTAAKKLAEEKKKFENNCAKLSDWMNQDISKKIHTKYAYSKRYTEINWPFYPCDIKSVRDFYDHVPGLEEEIEDLVSAIFWLNAEMDIKQSLFDKEKERIEKAKIRAAEELLASQKEQVAKWVKANGSQSQVDRLAANLLPMDEIKNLIRQEAYLALDKVPRYKKISISDFCTCDDYEYDSDNISYDTEVKESATAEEFAQLQGMQSVLPYAKFELCNHIGKCDQCEQEYHRTSIKVRLTIGAFSFMREYSMWNPDNE